jgi:hypothetical protein
MTGGRHRPTSASETPILDAAVIVFLTLSDWQLRSDQTRQGLKSLRRPTNGRWLCALSWPIIGVGRLSSLPQMCSRRVSRQPTV